MADSPLLCSMKSIGTVYGMNSSPVFGAACGGPPPPNPGGPLGITGTGSHAPRGGPVATAGGVLFVGTSSDRKFRARDMDTGRVLWEHDLPAATEGVPAVYEVDGRQYVTIAVGGNGLFSQALDLPEPGPGQYMTFALPER